MTARDGQFLARFVRTCQIVLTFLLAVPSTAQDRDGGAISGTATFAPGNELAPSITVYLEASEGSRMTTETDELGRYAFHNLDPGVYFVESGCWGCGWVAQPNVVVEAGQTTLIDFSLLWNENPGPRRLTPCEGAATLDSGSLQLRDRLLHNLGLAGRSLARQFDEGVDLALRMLELPDYGNGPESVVSVRLSEIGEENSTRAEVLVTEAQDEIRRANAYEQNSRGRWTWRGKLVEPPIVMPVDHYRASIAADVAERLRALFRTAVLDAEYRNLGKRGPTHHGVTFEFLASWFSMAGRACGEVYSPDWRSPTALLVEIGQRLREYAKADVAERSSIMRHVHLLITKAETLFPPSTRATPPPPGLHGSRDADRQR